ncbi:MAG: glycosyltransferase family 2 protein, partial [Gemmatimonadetes bacterium]|nr:glycosyltransferase family 2 protein [Gemmatimonadota bacterium]NIS01672.1 glycosyltransferase family 2 protein [Gemmatimonadota bacterium]NIT67406.1 glycosyltransferase family 2 protein [Gemmatimonadota bacterium]NIU52836.1 glycosyltransferase [Gemmatimonadota bacterium]NIV24133.1 glycosyltransferase [Gemmatimonadota bacterium]
PRVVVRRTANRGQPAALNLGLGIARAPLVAFLDSDDEYEPDHLSLLVGSLHEDDLDFVLASFELIVCSDDPEPRVADFYHPDRSIPVREIECITGVLFGKKAVFDA